MQNFEFEPGRAFEETLNRLADGLFSDRGERKEAFYVLRDYYRSLAAGGDKAQPSGSKMVWHDEFDGAKLDPAKWAYVVGGTGFRLSRIR